MHTNAFVVLFCIIHFFLSLYFVCTSFIEIVVPIRCIARFRCIYSIFVMHTHTKTVVFVCHALIFRLLWMQHRKDVASECTHISTVREQLASSSHCHLISIWRYFWARFLSHKIKLSAIDSASFISFLPVLLWRDYCSIQMKYALVSWNRTFNTYRYSLLQHCIAFWMLSVACWWKKTKNRTKASEVWINDVDD